MRARLSGVLAGCLCLALADSVAAAQGTVIWKNQDCSYFILQTPKGYTLFEWVSGAAPQDGDVLDGELNARGSVQLYNRTADMPLTAYAAARSTRKSDIEKDVPSRCR
jgi:hypothetical protein